MTNDISTKSRKFFDYYHIDNSSNAENEQYKNAVLLSLAGKKKLAQHLFNSCLHNITNLNLINGYIDLQWEYITENEKNEIMEYIISFSDNDLENYPYLIKALVDFMEKGTPGYKRLINLLNYKISSKNSDQVIVTFSSRNDDQKRLMFSFSNLLANYNVDILFLRDIQDAWYNKGFYGISDTVESSVKFLKTLLVNYNKIIMMGSSSGGYASILFGSLLKVNEVLAFSPQTLLPRPKPFPDIRLLTDVDAKYYDLVPYLNFKTHISVYFSSGYQNDYDAAMRIKDYANIHLFPLNAGREHVVIPYLLKNNMFFPIIDKIIG